MLNNLKFIIENEIIKPDYCQVLYFRKELLSIFIIFTPGCLKYISKLFIITITNFN